MFDLKKLNEQQVKSLCYEAMRDHAVDALWPSNLLPEGRRYPAGQTREFYLTFIQEYLGAKKEFYQLHPQLVHEDFNKRLEHSGIADLFLIPAEGQDTITKMMKCDPFHRGSVNPEHFLEALERGRNDVPRYVDILIAQARELAYITDKSLAEAMKERLLHAGLTPFQAGILADVTHAYENNKHEHFLEELKRIHGPAASESARAIENTAKKVADESLLARESQASRGSYSAGSSAWKWGIIAATVGLGAVIGYWAWKSKEKKREQQTSKNETVLNPSR